jgi:hypothetical protein
LRPATRVRRRRHRRRAPRRSTAGSIADPATPAVATSPRSVLPPFLGGLHCGWTNFGKGQPETLVLPPFTGGPRCGQAKDDKHMFGNTVLPLSDGGLHCGWEVTNLFSQKNKLCSRRRRQAPLRRGQEDLSGIKEPVFPPPMAGSTAARSRSASTATTPSCSHCSTTGSIAVAITTSGAPRPGLGAPAVQRRAPLRQVHGDIPADHRSGFPPLTGGLHCGMKQLRFHSAA